MPKPEELWTSAQLMNAIDPKVTLIHLAIYDHGQMVSVGAVADSYFVERVSELIGETLKGDHRPVCRGGAGLPAGAAQTGRPPMFNTPGRGQCPSVADPAPRSRVE